jgi:hypothetical protein
VRFGPAQNNARIFGKGGGEVEKCGNVEIFKEKCAGAQVMRK